MTASNSMYFSRHVDGTVTIHHPADRAEWALDLLTDTSIGASLRWENGVVSFLNSDGTLYRWRETHRIDGVVYTEAIDAEDAQRVPASRSAVNAKGAS